MRDFSIDIIWAKVQMAIAAIGGWLGYKLPFIDYNDSANGVLPTEVALGSRQLEKSMVGTPVKALQELLMQLGGEPDGFGLGSITYATSTPNGFLALDGNMREVILWTADGTWIGAADDGDLFGTSYPWIAAADIADDGSILVVMSDTRPDESADEVLVFTLSGF